MKRIETIDIDAPAYWASFLVNGDDSSMDAIEQRECAAWLADLPFSHGDCIDANDEFMGRFNFAEQGNLMCTLMTYTFAVTGESK